MNSIVNMTSENPTWSTPDEVNSGMSGTSAYAHVASSDGVNVFVLWGQASPRDPQLGTHMFLTAGTVEACGATPSTSVTIQ